MQTFTDGKNVNDLEQVWFVDAVKMPIALNTTYIMGYGVAQMFSGAIAVPGLIRTIGSRGFTSFTNFTNFFAHILWGAVPRPWAMFAALALATPGIDSHSNTAVKVRFVIQDDEFFIENEELCIRNDEF